MIFEPASFRFRFSVVRKFSLEVKSSTVSLKRSSRFPIRRSVYRASWQFFSLDVRRRALHVSRIQRIAYFRRILLPSSWSFFDQYRFVSRIIVNHPSIGNRLINRSEVIPTSTKATNDVSFRNTMPTLLNTESNSA